MIILKNRKLTLMRNQYQLDAIPEYIRKDISHKQRELKHNDGVKYQCNQCNFKASFPSNLQQHIKSIHEGVKYPCDQCKFKAARPDSLQQHIKSIHDGVKYPCDQCDYKAARPSNLQGHIKSIHEGLKRPR